MIDTLRMLTQVPGFGRSSSPPPPPPPLPLPPPPPPKPEPIPDPPKPPKQAEVLAKLAAKKLAKKRSGYSGSIQTGPMGLSDDEDLDLTKKSLIGS
jgi:hypothetical protein